MVPLPIISALLFVLLLPFDTISYSNAFIIPNTSSLHSFPHVHQHTVDRTSITVSKTSTYDANTQFTKSSTGLYLSPLPEGISPFEKSLSKSIDVQANFRNRAKPAVENAISDGIRLMEIEFPPLIGGDQSKNQFDDFDNIQELEKNKDWTMLFAPNFLGKKGYDEGKTWLVFPDLKECEIARKEWAGNTYKLATFTTIEAATNFLDGNYDAPWGSSLVSGVSKLMGGEKGDAGLLGDISALDDLVQGKNAPATIAFIIQPGNGGPVEDWVNCEKIHLASPDTAMVIINGALDKVRGGYYPGVFFPKLAATVDRFFKTFESVFYLKPISDKGVYGWLYRVYPEPWQVVLQTAENVNNEIKIENTVVYTSDERPEYNQAIQILISANAASQTT